MVGSAKKKQNRYSYADYLNWGDEKRCEIINGEIYDMTAPSILHQSISMELGRQLANFFIDRPCRVFTAPVDVTLDKKSKKNDEIFTVVQPDIMVVCDEKKIEEQRVVGAPDLIIEIISPSTAAKDNITKKALYEKAGVMEFWLVSPTDRITRVYRLEKDGLFGRESIYDDQAKIDIALFAGLSIDCRRVFPKQPEIKRVKEPPMQYL
ncbi:MAG: Uma2 family endonuclease [Candidatus Rifleibacteriota bacterium]